ncbi:TlpA disulfide reductase family protein [Segatella copri]|uniref:TlpA family protein disulfide reductase n=1 Tax=Segatella copri TaxID=165179 RepID=UPI00293B45BC|nr:TlpA disulfide reductase family protein [Segatella copri]MDV3107167.1 TlpA disulfide reductase family protein [Segatella copri]WOF86724.1 TlpA disulfide reductase family protein [Segatella copri]WOF92980.1 TlpA disulfide reductase family protein [Segatella copri]
MFLGILFMLSTIQVGAQDFRDEVEDSLKAFSERNAAAADWIKTYNSSYDYAVFFPFDDEKDPLAGKDRVKVLEEKYKHLSGQLKKIKDARIRQYLGHLNEDARINFLTRILPKNDARRKEMISGIDVNSWLGLYNYLPQRVIKASMDASLDSLYGHDMTEYGLAKMQAISARVTNAKVRHALLDDCAYDVLLYGKDYADIDRFWKPYCEMVGSDSSLIHKYAYMVEAIKNTKRGMMAPEFFFTDREGKVHSSKEFLGKVVYIDCWATWCGPCCREIPYLEKRVAEYQGNGKVRFVSISMDSNRQAWLKKLDKDNPAWEQFILDKVQDEALSKAFGINGIPRFILLNADGTIADSDAFRPSDKDFHQQLDAVLNK